MKKMDYDDWRSAHGVAEPSQGVKTMKLGDKLKQTLDELEQAKIKGIEAQAAADMEALRRARADIEHWLEQTRLEFVTQINLGRVPLKKVKEYNRRAWLQEANNGQASNHDLWNKFRQFWISEGLEPVLQDAHDGVGIESWINLTVKVLPSRPRSAVDANIDVYNG